MVAKAIAITLGCLLVTAMAMPGAEDVMLFNLAQQAGSEEASLLQLDAHEASLASAGAARALEESNSHATNDKQALGQDMLKLRQELKLSAKIKADPTLDERLAYLEARLNKCCPVNMTSALEHLPDDCGSPCAPFSRCWPCTNKWRAENGGPFADMKAAQLFPAPTGDGSSDQAKPVGDPSPVCDCKVKAGTIDWSRVGDKQIEAINYADYGLGTDDTMCMMNIGGAASLGVDADGRVLGQPQGNGPGVCFSWRTKADQPLMQVAYKVTNVHQTTHSEPKYYDTKVTAFVGDRWKGKEVPDANSGNWHNLDIFQHTALKTSKYKVYNEEWKDNVEGTVRIGGGETLNICGLITTFGRVVNGGTMAGWPHPTGPTWEANTYPVFKIETLKTEVL